MTMSGGSDLDILRRIAERGIKLAQREGAQFIDLFQHMLDEIERVRLGVDRLQTQRDEALALAKFRMQVADERFAQIADLETQREELRTALHWAQQELMKWDARQGKYEYRDSPAAQTLEKTK